MKRTTWLSILLITIFVVLFVLARLTATKDSGSQTIRIGALLPLTGQYAGIGESILKGYERKVEELNSDGKNVELVVEDSKSGLTDGTVSFVKLGDVDVLSHNLISDNDASALGDRVSALRSRRTGILYQDDEPGRAESKALAVKISATGGAAVPLSVDYKATDFRVPISKLIGQKIDSLVLIVTEPTLEKVVKQARELGFKGDIISSAGIVITPEIAYTDIEILMSAIEQSGTTDAMQVVRYIRSLRSFQGKYEKVEITSDSKIMIQTAVKQW